MNMHSRRTLTRPTTTTPRRAPARPATRRVLRRALTALLLTGGMLIAAGSAASAHDTLADSNPAEGETLTEPPAEIRLTFSGDVLELGAAMEVTDGDGATWPTGEPAIDGPDVTVEVEEVLPGGDYEVAWRVTSSDGHPISGVIPFTVDAPATPTTDPTATPTTDPTATDTTSTPSEEPSTATETPEEPADDEPTESDGGLPWLPIILGVAVAGAAYAVVRVVRRGGPTNGDD